MIILLLNKEEKISMTKRLFLKTINLLRLIWQLTSYSKFGDIPVYIQVQNKIYPITDVSCLSNIDGNDNGLVINISSICGGEIPKDCITCNHNVFGKCYYYNPHKNVLNNQLYCDGEYWEPIERE